MAMQSNTVRITELEQEIAALKSKMTQADMHASAAFEMSSKQFQASPVSMEDFATFRMGIVMILGERLTDADQNPVSLADLVTRIDGMAMTLAAVKAEDDIGHFHPESSHDHAGLLSRMDTLAEEVEAASYSGASHTHPGADHNHDGHSHTFVMS